HRAIDGAVGDSESARRSLNWWPLRRVSGSRTSWLRGWSLLSRIDAGQDRFDPPLVGGRSAAGGVTVEDGEAGPGRSSLQIDDPGGSAFPGGYHDWSWVTHSSQSSVGRGDIDQLGSIGGRVVGEDAGEFGVVGLGGGRLGGVDRGVGVGHAFHGKARLGGGPAGGPVEAGGGLHGSGQVVVVAAEEPADTVVDDLRGGPGGGGDHGG